ncbi:MAG: hypothetical protein Q7J69_06760 [Candidatus Omnitrophota bacterium]|nr:hypothetical protein [Candidatus Omnitrophota bacterium]
MKKIMNMLSAVICFTLVAQLAGCGTLIHPDRRGQKSGRIDPAIAILDGIGLLFFVIPGLIAFAIDFSTGAIYLPGGRLARFDHKRTTVASIEEIICKETGHRVKLTQANMQVSRLESLEELKKRFAEISPVEKNIRVALNTK